MKLTDLTLAILDLNAASDSGDFDDYTMVEAREDIEHRRVFESLSRRGFKPQTIGEPVQKALQDEWFEIWGGYEGRERRKWGVQNRGINLLIAWTNEIIQSGALDGRWK